MTRASRAGEWCVFQTGAAPMNAPLRTTVAHLLDEHGHPVCGRMPRRVRHPMYAYPDDPRCARCTRVGNAR